ncbi:MAG: HAMP domain-containing sensor histidine kinase [Gemmatimonadales bacterium]
MIRSHAFRTRLAWRFAITVSALLLLASVLAWLALRTFLHRRLDSTVLRLAQIEAAATADSPDERVHFHDDVFLSAGPGHEAILTRYGQVWTRDGRPVVRTRNLEGRDLPLPAEVRQRVNRSNEPQLFSFDWEGDGYRAVLYPLGVLGPSHAAYVLEVAASTAETSALLRHVLAFLVGLVLVGFAAGGALGWWLAGYAVRPVLEIIRDAEAFPVAGRGHRITAHADTDEFRRLLAVLNGMLSRIDEAMESQRRFLADAGHAIKTPLTILRGDIDVTLQRDRTREEYHRVLTQTLEDLRDASTLAEDLITLARSDGGALTADLTTIPVEEVLRRVARRFARTAERAGVHLAVEPGAGITVRADPVLLERALDNLADNAIKYGHEGGTVTLAAARRDDGSCEIRVQDLGPGIDPVDRARVFDRFYRGVQGLGTTSGSGLGLATVRAVTDAMGGSVELDTTLHRGTTVRLVFPK